MSQQDNLDEFLSRHLKMNSNYLDDEGFTDQVMSALGSVHCIPWWRRPLAVVPVAILSVLIVSQLPLLESGIQVWHWLATADLMTLLKTGGTVLAGFSLACFGWLARQMNLA